MWTPARLLILTVLPCAACWVVAGVPASAGMAVPSRAAADGTGQTLVGPNNVGNRLPPVVGGPWNYRLSPALGRFWDCVDAGQLARAADLFPSLATFDERYRAAAHVVYRGRASDNDGLASRGFLLELAISLADTMLKQESNAHHRAAVYRVLAEAHALLRHPDETIQNAGHAVRLNPRSPWGWYWLAEGYHLGGFYASEATARKHELLLFPGDSEDDRRSRRQIWRRLGLLYRRSFHDPEKAIWYFRAAGDYLNLIFALVQDLHDLEAAQAVLEEIKRVDPVLLSYAIVREDLRGLGLDPGSDP